jgi:hypothetical protein
MSSPVHEHSGDGAMAAGSTVTLQGPRWLGPPLAEEPGKRLFEGFEEGALHFHLGESHCGLQRPKGSGLCRLPRKPPSASAHVRFGAARN